MIEPAHIDDDRTALRAATPTGWLAEMFTTYQGEGPHVGKRQLFLRLGGCTIGCRYCDTPDALRAGQRFEVRGAGPSAVATHANPLDARTVADLVHRAAAAEPALHAIAVTGGEPLEQARFLADLFPRLAPLPILLETAGTLPDELATIVRHVAIVSMDVKLPSVARTPDRFAAHRRFLEIARADRARDVYVKVIVNENVDDDEWLRAVQLVREVDASVPFVVQPETARRGALAASFPLLARLADTATREGLKDVRVIPQTHKFLGAP